MAPKRQRGRPVSPSGAKNETLATRISGDLREQLDRAAAAKGRSLSNEVGIRLDRSFQEEHLEQDIVERLGGRKTFGLLLAIAGLIEEIESITMERWHDDPYTAAAIADAIPVVLKNLAPAHDGEGDPEAPEGTLVMRGERAHTPRQLGHMVAYLNLRGIYRAPPREVKLPYKDPDGWTHDAADFVKKDAMAKEYLGELVERAKDELVARSKGERIELEEKKP